MTTKYVLYAIIYTIIVCAIVFSVNSDNYTITLFSKEFSLPVAFWFALPLGVLVILSALHMIFYKLKVFFNQKAIKSDLEGFEAFAKEIFLGLDSNKELKTGLFDSSLGALRALNPWGVDKNVKFKDEELNEAYRAYLAIKEGVVADIRRFRLLKNNPLYIQNEINKIKDDFKYAISVLGGNNDAKITAAARAQLILKGNWTQISKFSLKFEFSEVLELISRHANAELELKGNELLSLLNSGDFSSKDYLQCAKILKKKIAPDSLISIFKELKNEHSACSEAYLYLLYDLQMIEDLRAALRECEGEEFERIEALLFLREHGKIAKADFIYNL